MRHGASCYRAVFLHITCNVKQVVSLLGLQIIFFRKLVVNTNTRELNLNGKKCYTDVF